uniref:ATP-dependent zinc metalloprotease FtsH n=1 Tax=Cyanidium caldarium TaxID=2771 RepID=FTSH_CYACA|nr:cell division protein [Cyanidium caldarium]O19922.1 RecName: Full=ATP-dependent zinc metalloprotease FtsH [Cyanidium caldarium]AAB82667.1 unknown [Cyanidium caldarium]WDB00221.1 cell division protein [Cyanidium caldarium]
MKKQWKKIVLFVLPVIITLITLSSFLFYNQDVVHNWSSSRMTYGRFLEYIDMNWVKKVDLYDNARTAIVDIINPDIKGEEQLVRVELPTFSSELVSKLKNKLIDFDAHPSSSNVNLVSWLSNLLLPLILIITLFFFFRRGNKSSSGPGQAFNFGKAKARFHMEAKTGIVFEDVAGIEEAKEELQEIVAFLKDSRKFTNVGATIPKGVLLVGPPGTGKTLLAKAIAGEASAPFFSISGSEFVEMFVGVGASRVRDLFKKAKEKAPCIVFIDEIDAVGRQRGVGIGGGNDEREQTLNQLLTEMDGFSGDTGVIVVAATNRIDVLDSALLRPGRFDRQIMVSLPNINGRLAILKVHSKKKKIHKDVLLEVIARRTPGFSGADLANLLNEAAILTVRRGKVEITMKEIEDSIDKIIAGLEGSPLADSRIKRLIAYHEAGHAVAATFLPHHDPVQKVTLIPRRQAKGLTWFLPNDDQFLVSKSQILSKIIAALAGRAMEEIVFGLPEVTIGAANDIKQVTFMARQMVTKFGMSKVGPICLENSSSEVFIGRDLMGRHELSEEMVAKVDLEVRSILKDCYIQARTILSQNRKLIDRVVNELVEKETIEAKEFMRIVEERV